MGEDETCPNCFADMEWCDGWCVVCDVCFSDVCDGDCGGND